MEARTATRPNRQETNTSETKSSVNPYKAVTTPVLIRPAISTGRRPTLSVSQPPAVTTSRFTTADTASTWPMADSSRPSESAAYSGISVIRAPPRITKMAKVTNMSALKAGARITDLAAR